MTAPAVALGALGRLSALSAPGGLAEDAAAAGALAIAPRRLTPLAHDPEALLAAALADVRATAGRTWTDHNVHDPGVTTLEVLCYALTDLAYRAGLPVADLTARPGDDDARRRARFPTAREVLPARALTARDYRKLLIDLPGVQNAWVAPADATLWASADEGRTRVAPPGEGAPGWRPLAVRGLYDARLEFADDVRTAERRAEVAEAARRALHANRNLCEDFAAVGEVPVQAFAVCAELELAPDADLAATHAAVLFAVQQYLAPPVPQRPLAEMLARAHPDGTPYTVDEVFDGPALVHGFVDDAELAAAELRAELRLSDVIGAVLAVPGVRAVRDALVSPADALGAGRPETRWRVPVAAGHQARLDRARSRLVLHKLGMPFVAPPAQAAAAYDALAAAARARAETPRAEDLPVPAGRPRDAGAYQSVQPHFPAVYGVGEAGVPGARTPRRVALARQFQGWLLLLDQLLAGLAAQIGHAGELLSADPAVDRAWFQAPVTDGAAWRDLYADAAPASPGEPDAPRLARAAARLAALAADAGAQAAARNRLLDHLIARRGERFHEFAEVMRTEFGAPPASMIAPKCAFLADHAAVSAARGLGYDHTLQDDAALWDSDNVSGLERRLARLLGLPTARRRNLADVTHDAYDEVDAVDDGAEEFRWRVRHRATRKKLLSASTRYPTREAARAEMYRALQWAAVPAGYRRERDAQGRHYFNVADDRGEVLGRRIEYFRTAEAMEAAIAELTAYVREAYAPEGMYVVEAILLRPERPDDDVPLAPCPGAGCTDCADADPFSYRLHVVLPAFAGRFADAEFRRWAEGVIRAEVPAHVEPRVCWAGREDMAELEGRYREWLPVRAGRAPADGAPADRGARWQAFVRALTRVRSVYPAQRLRECDAPEGARKFLLGRTALGSADA